MISNAVCHAGGVPADASLATLRQALTRINASVRERHEAGENAIVLVPARARNIDRLLNSIWMQVGLASPCRTCLVAVGGYGRGELHPCSDVDLLILRPDALARENEERIKRFVATLWDIGLKIGHSVRSVKQCEADARQDLGLATSLMESRLLTGPVALFDDLRKRTGPDHVWPSPAFFEAKRQEQISRHHRFNDTASNLEPNVKEGPGGLRDLHSIAWVAKRHFGTSTLSDLVERAFLTESEYRALEEVRFLLWEIRFRLHLLSGRSEDRLLFDYQRHLAGLFGYHDDNLNLAIEKFMKRFYRHVAELARLNEMLLERFDEAILQADTPHETTVINTRFRAVNEFVEVKDRLVFERHPVALLEIFLVLQQRPDLKGVRASTIRLIRDHRHLIDSGFRADPRACKLFLEILRHPRGVSRELRRMHRYGLLAEYLPAFGTVVGQMQYDLFHAYTVDEHSLFVLDNLRAFAVPENHGEFPLCTAVFKELPKPELLYIAGLFHDIGKGQGEDHCEAGARLALDFCARHGLSRYDSRLVAWLVRHHLLMSLTAQRRDIMDPEVINEFARQVGDKTHLDCLYLLTVADIRATNPNLWNDWKDNLLRDLYFAGDYALRRGMENPIDRNDLVAQAMAKATELLGVDGETARAASTLWRSWGADYFLRYTPEEICWHTRAILRTSAENLPLVLVRQRPGGTEIFAYVADRKHLFAASVSALDRQGCTVLDSRILTADNAMTLNSYVVSELDGSPVSAPARVVAIEGTLRQALREPGAERPRARRRAVSRRIEHFDIPAEVRFHADDRNGRSLIEVIAADRPGLLARIGWSLADCGVRLQNAKIATMGERAEDMFFVTDRQNRPLDPETRKQVRRHLLAALGTPPRTAGSLGSRPRHAARSRREGSVSPLPATRDQPPVTGGKKATSSPSPTG